MVTWLTYRDDVAGRGSWEVGSVEQSAQDRGGSEDCFVFTSWLVGAFDSTLCTLENSCV